MEHAIEDYKDSVSRHALMKIGDEAVAALRAQHQTTLTELVVWLEVDRIIGKRLKLPNYARWQTKRLKLLTELRRPEHWGMTPDAVFVRALEDSADRHVLLAGADREGPALYLAAHGCAVTAVDTAHDAVTRVLHAAQVAGLRERVRGYCEELGNWLPDVELHAVVCAPTAFAGLCVHGRARVIDTLQDATADGGVHLVETLVAPAGEEQVLLDELEARYNGWSIAVEPADGAGHLFLARKRRAA